MHRIIKYTILFIAVLLLQVLLLNNLNIGIYFYPLIYLAFIVLLPVDASPFATLMGGLAVGVAADLMLGMAGINTIASLLSAFLRPVLLTYTIGKDTVRDGGIPLTSRIGTGKYFRYSTVLIFIHCITVFSLEALSLSHIWLTSLKILCSGAATVLLVWLIQLLMSQTGDTSKRDEN